jgi:hypothetical protein
MMDVPETMMTTVINPKQFQIGDSLVSTEGDTAFVLQVGTTTGGPYTASSATVLISSLSLANNVYTGNWSSLTWAPALKPFTTYFLVAEAQNAIGVSGGSPEQSFSLATAPAPPTSLVLS